MKRIELAEDLFACRHSHIAMVARRLAKIRGMDCEGDDIEKPDCDPEASGGGEIRVIPIRGIIARDVSGWFPFATDTEEIEELIREAARDANVSGIVLDIDSPGGTVNGTIELGDLVKNVSDNEKPIVAYSAGMMCSAAYWIAAGCSGIYARRSAEIGSVGVYSVVLNMSEMFKMSGVEVELFKSGEHKGAGYPGTELTDEQRALIESEVAATGSVFRLHVTSNRQIQEEDMQGQSFTGDDAIKRGFVNQKVDSIQSAIEALIT